MGKTRLGKQFLEIASEEKPFAGEFHAARLDWEERRTRAVESQFLLSDPDEVDFNALYYHVYAFLRDLGYGDRFQRI